MKDNSLPESFPANAESINTIVDGLGALVLCLAKHMTPEAKATLASDLARLSANGTASGRPMFGRLMGDLSRAASL